MRYGKQRRKRLAHVEQKEIAHHAVIASHCFESSTREPVDRPFRMCAISLAMTGVCILRRPSCRLTKPYTPHRSLIRVRGSIPADFHADELGRVRCEHRGRHSARDTAIVECDRRRLRNRGWRDDRHGRRVRQEVTQTVAVGRGAGRPCAGATGGAWR